MSKPEIKTTVQLDPKNNLREIVVLQKTIQEVADFASKLNNSNLKRRAVVILIQDIIGEKKINKKQIEDVLDAAESLGKVYLK